MEVPNFIQKIDWSELRNQKRLLLETINNDSVSPEHKEALEGILALIDAIQDYAVDEAQIVSAIHVYDFELEDGERSDMLEGETDECYFARTNAKTIFEICIEGEFLYEDEEMSKEFIESIVDNPEHAERIKELIRLSILKDVMEHPEDFKKDEHGHFTYDYTMRDYGHAIDSYCHQQFLLGKTKTVLVCSNCGGQNVQTKTWRNPNSGELGEPISYEEEDCWCENCDEHHPLIPKEVPLT
jgi:hypothetical protein